MVKMVSKFNKEDNSVTIVLESLVGGGAERSSIELSKCLLLAKYDVDLVLLEFKGELLNQIPKGVRLYVISKPKKTQAKIVECNVPAAEINWLLPDSKSLIGYSDFFRYVVPNWPFGLKRILSRRDRYVRYANGFATYLNRNSPHFVFAMMHHACFSVLVGREIGGYNVPVICSIRNSLKSQSVPQLQIYRGLLHKSDWVHTLSKEMKIELSELNLYPSEKTTAIYNFFESSRVERLASLASGHPWLDRKEAFGYKVILAVGRLHVQKNFELLLRSFARLKSLGNLKLVILGEGALRHTLQSQIDKHHLIDKVSMPGWTANPYAFMRRADVFVLSSKWEGFGLVLIEALACGCKVVSTNCATGPKEILDHGRFGDLVPVDDEEAMSDAITNALDSVPDREKLINRALEFSPQNFLVQFNRLIADAIATNRND